MKYLLAGCLLFAAGTTQAQYAYTITGHVKNLPMPRYMYLTKNWREMEVQDSVPIVNGVFRYKSVLKQPDAMMAFLFVGYHDAKQGGKYVKKMMTNLYLEKGNIQVKIDGPGYRDSTTVSGTPTNNDHRQLLQLKQQNDNAVRQLSDSIKAAGLANEERAALVKEHQIKFYMDYVHAHPASYLSLEILGADLWRLEKPAALAAAFKTLTPAMQQSITGSALQQQLSSAMTVKVNMEAPGFTEKDTSGIPVALSNYRGKYVLIDFWASWCHPCREENPYLKAAYQQYKDSNFTIVSISMDNSKNAWLKAVHDDQLPWQQLSALNPDTSESANKYGVKAIPRNFLIDPSGKIIAMDLRKEAVEETLKKMLR